MFLGTLVICTGILNSLSYVSLSVMSSQNTPETARKNKKTRNSLLAVPNKKFLIVLAIMRNLPIPPYFAAGIAPVASLNT